MKRKGRSLFSMALVLIILLSSMFVPSKISAVAMEGSRNIAKNRAVYHNTVYQANAANFHNTGHLTTDGIYRPTSSPTNPVITQSQTDSPANEEVWCAFDGLSSTKYLAFSTNAWVQYQFTGNQKFAVAKYSIITANDDASRDPRTWTLYGVKDDNSLEAVHTVSNGALPSARNTLKEFTPDTTNVAYKGYRLHFTANSGDAQNRTQFAELTFYDAAGNNLITPYVTSFESYWQSSSSANEWLYIDLGGQSLFDKIKLYWDTSNYATSYDISVSDDTKTWIPVKSVSGSNGGDEEVILDSPASGRYVKFDWKTSSGTIYKVFEIEVFGTNDVSVTPEALPSPEPDGTQYLRGGNWKLQRASEVSATGEQLSASSYNDEDWQVATVPGTVLTSYLNNGAVPDPNFGDQQFLLSDTYFTSDFWYRDSFVIPSEKQGQKIWLNFNNINWKADIYFNGQKIGDIKGAFIRGKFDVTDIANYGEGNYLAVYIYKNDTPGSVDPHTMSSAGTNGGVLGRDNPTIHPSIGWDWVPTIRGRNIGIYGDVFLNYSGTVQLIDPWVETHLKPAVAGNTAPDAVLNLSTAYLTYRTEVKNTTDVPVSALVSGKLTSPDGSYTKEYSKNVTIPANSIETVVIDDIVIDDPNLQLWWPNRYGDQPLYKNETSVKLGAQVSDTKTFNVGIRELRTTPTTETHTNSGTATLKVYVNGQRIYCTGGNWGMDESMLRCDAEDYDIKVRMHKEANFTMIRNWVGQTGNEEFYNACDKYGILVFDDFWLANPVDGANPADYDMFMKNAVDKIKVVRKHVSVAFYCGRNEGVPPGEGGNERGSNFPLSAWPEPAGRSLRDELKKAIVLHDSSRIFVPDSASPADGIRVSGHGPYTVQGPSYYFANSNENFHSERGMPNLPSVESIKKMIPEENLWPIDVMWGLHDFTSGSAQNGNAFQTQARLYGEYNSLEEFSKRAQLVNYENHKALMEGPSMSKGNAMLMWMSQSAWPSMVWQTYDYYYDTNAGYFGVKAGNQPVNAFYDCRTDQRRIVVANNSGKNYTNLNLTVNAYNLNGAQISNQTAQFNLSPDQVITSGLVNSPVTTSTPNRTNMNFITTKITNNDGDVISENFYWMSFSSSNTDLQNLEKVYLKTEYTQQKTGSTNFITATVKNVMNVPALMIRIKTLKDTSGDQILPAFYSDNYFSLMPGETKEITIEFDDKYLNGESPELFVEGWNIESAKFGDSIPQFTSAPLKFTANDEAITTIAPGPVYLEATVTAIEDINTKVHLITALYKNKKLIDFVVEPKPINLTADESITLKTTQALTIPADDFTNCEVKGFLWDDQMNPIASYIDLEKWKPENINLALNRPSSASSTSGDYPLTNGNDGNNSTQWETAGVQSHDHWYQVDLGFEADISKIVIDWGSSTVSNTSNGGNYRIEVATQPGVFTTAHTFTGTGGNTNWAGAGSTNTVTLNAPGVKARYVRIFKPFSGSTATRMQIRELEVYGSEPAADEIRLMKPYDITSFANIPISFSAVWYGYYGAGTIDMTAEDLPSGATFTPNGLFTWTPTGAQIGDHAIKLKVSNGVTSDEKTFNITVKPVNLALNKTTASSSSDAGNVSGRGVDGNYGLRWASQYSTNRAAEWFVVDLGAEYDISKIVIAWEDAYGVGYRIDTATGASMPSSTLTEGTSPNSPWVARKTVNGSTGGIKDSAYPANVFGVETITLDEPVTARYVRFYGQTRRSFGSSYYGYSMWEFEVYE